jgi:hypothetical protein
MFGEAEGLTVFTRSLTPGPLALAGPLRFRFVLWPWSTMQVQSLDAEGMSPPQKGMILGGPNARIRVEQHLVCRSGGNETSGVEESRHSDRFDCEVDNRAVAPTPDAWRRIASTTRPSLRHRLLTRFAYRRLRIIMPERTLPC